jgi:hypothetical protein
MAPQSRVKRIQTLLTSDEYALLEEYSKHIQKPISTLVRETLKHTLLAELQKHRTQRALARLTGQELPVSDWYIMEQEIERMWEEQNV